MTDKSNIVEQARLDILAKLTDKKGTDLTQEEIKTILETYFTSESIPTELSDLTHNLISKDGGYTIKLSEVLNGVAIGTNSPSVEDNWIVAWTYDGTDWSTAQQPGTELAGRIIAKAYKTNNKVMLWRDSVNDEVEYDTYSLQIIGNGDMGALEVDDGDTAYAWQTYFLDDSTWFPELITNVSISENITSIGEYAFCGNSLTSITIPNTVTSIKASAFDGSALTTITIHNSVTSIGLSAFANCWLSDVYYIGSSIDWNSIIIDNGNNQLLNASMHYSTESEVNETL